jgi:NAD(P)-dependent dehydrogenase (short-subunit alcohol dehydrogenase family)
MKILANKTTAITGAASGIGRMLAINLANEGCNLALADVDRQGLEETAQLVGNKVRVSLYTVDVSDKEQVFRYADDASAHHGGVDIIINNAGVAIGDFLETVSFEDFEWLFGINFWGVVYGTKAFLPHLKKRPEGHVVNISSINGIMPNPNNGPYCASKFAVKGFTETLAQEMIGTSIGVSCVHPGWIPTGIARNARFRNALYSMTRDQAMAIFDEVMNRGTPDSVAKAIIKGIKRGKRRILIGADAKVLDMLTRLFPAMTVSLTAYFCNLLAWYYARKR